ncbi:MAG: SDR family NAD(P)-dependent oxidoreductase [Mycobacteriales bacterium]
MGALKRQVALVTGASRGIGRGVAVGLGEAGATVVVTGRTAQDVEATADLVTAAGGTGIGVMCDHRRDDQVRAVFDQLQRDLGRLDLLVNNATAVPALPLLFAETPFWELPVQMWDDLFQVGLRSHFVAWAAAAPLMIADGGGLIVNISSAGAIARIGAVLPYGVAKSALDRMTADMAEELRDHRVTALSLWPPPTSTPGMLAAAGADDEPTSWSVPEFTGRVVAALAASGHFSRTGRAFRARELAAELGVADALYAAAHG